jgi:TolA-binding protein
MSNNNDDLEAEEIWGGAGGDGAGAAAGAGEPPKDGPSGGAAAGAAGNAGEDSKMEEDDVIALDDETMAMSTPELRQRIRLLDNEIRIMRSDIQRITHESRGQRERINENMEKVKLNKQLPYLVGNVVEVLEPDAEDGT